MSRLPLLLAACLFGSAAIAQTTPSTTRSTNTVGLGGTVSGTPSSTTPNAAPVRYDDPNSGMPSQVQVKTKATKTKAEKRSKMKGNM